MARKRQRAGAATAKKEGLPPGTTVYTGPLVEASVETTVFHYTKTGIKEFVPTDLAEVGACRAAGGITWVNVSGIHHVPTIETVCAAFGVHPLAVEDICNVGTRAKAEEYADHLYLVVKMLTLEKDAPGDETLGGSIHTEHTSIVIGKGYVLTFQEQHEGDVFDTVRRRLRDPRSRLRSFGADYLAYTLIDAVVDHYFSVLEWIGDKAEELEDAILARDDAKQLSRIYLLRRELTYFRKQVWPLRDGLSLLMRSDVGEISRDVRPFLRDVHDHVVQVVETIELYRELVLGLVDLHMTHVSNKMNEVMKLLTIISTIFIPLTFIAGVYGMNFEYMPELTWKYGYAGVWVVMLVAAGCMIGWFRHKRWL